MSDTLDQALRVLQGAQSLELERRVAALDRLGASLSHGASGSPKSLDGIITALPPILGSSQVIACQAALSCVQPLVGYVAREANVQTAKSLLHFLLPPLLDRLGDGRMAVRELALTTLSSMWSELQAMHDRKLPLDSTPSPTRSTSSRYSAIASSIPRFTTPFKSRILKPKAPASPSAGQWNAPLAFEREIQARGFAHKTWRVREMILEWLNLCVEEHNDFPALHYIDCTFALLDDNQDAVRFASKRVLNTIYHKRTDLQQDIITRAQSLVPARPSLLSSITAPIGEMAAMSASPYGYARSSSRLGAGLTRPGSRIAGPRSDSRIGRPAAGMQPPSFVPPMPSHIPEPSHQGAFPGVHPGYRSMSQQGVRPETRTGNSSPLSPGRNIRQQSLMHPPMPSMPQIGRAGGHQSLSNTSSPTAQPAIISSLQGDKRPLQALGSQPLKPSPQQRLLEPFIPSNEVPSGVRVHNVASKQNMVSEFLQTASVFAGRETEDNWVQRERAINLYRGMVWGNAAIEHTEDLVGCLKEGMLDVFKVVNSLRTSLSAIAMCLCEDVAMRLGPHAGSLFDTIVDVLVRQCTQTKKLSAQRAAKSLEVVFHYFPLRPKAVDSLRARMADKSAILRQAVVATCTGILRSHGYYMAAVDRRFADVLVSISEVVNVGVTDAQPSVREAARELYWALYSVSAPQATKLLPMFPDSTRAAIVRDKPLYARGSAAGGQPFSVTGVSRPTSATSMAPSPAGALEHRMPVLRASFSSSQGSPVASIMSVVADRSPHRPSVSSRSAGVAVATDVALPLFGHSSASLAVPSSESLLRKMEDDEHIEAIDSRCGGASDNDEVGTAPLSQFISENSTPLRLNRLRAPIQARMPLGLIDFSQMEVDEPLVVTSMPSRRILPPSEHTVGPTTAPAASGEEQSDSQATAVVAAAASISTASSSSSRLLEPTQTCSDAGYDSYHPSSAAAKSSAFDLTSAPTPGRSFTPTPGHILTPDRTPLMSPSPRNEPMQPGSINAAPVPGFPSNQFATPRTQTARYWHGPVEMFMPVSAPQLLAVESPMPAEARQRSAKIEGYLQRLEANSNVDEALFRSLARFAKDESSSVWINEANGSGGGGYLDRILHTCLSWLQAPAESRDTVFAKDRCFDVLRVLIHRKSQHFSLDISRRLLLEVLRNKFFDSTILSTSAEDVFYDMATHLDPDLCFELAEDFFKRASLPLEQSLAAPRSGYASCLESQISTPPDMDPMRVFAMDNALAGMFEFVVEVVKRLPSPDSITPRELEQFMPYSVACFIHPRSQVRKAALMPMVAVHEKLGLLDTELEELLLQTGPEQLAASPNPLARYVGMLHRPELRRLVWSYYLSKRDA